MSVLRNGQVEHPVRGSSLTIDISAAFGSPVESLFGKRCVLHPGLNEAMVGP